MKQHFWRIGFLVLLLTATGASTRAQSAPGIWISPAELAQRPTSGGAWEGLLSQANSTCSVPDLADQDDAANVCVLAKALVFARLGEERYRGDVVSALLTVISSDKYKGRALALGRELGAYALSADLISLQTYDPLLDQQFRDKIRELLTTPLSDGPKSLIECHERQPNNWGTHCGGARAAVAAYLGDTAELARVAQVFKGWLGDRSSYAGFVYGDLSWQCDATQPVGVNPTGCAKEGNSIDGVLADDQRRGGEFTWPPPQENYVYEALQGALLQATILHHAGYDVFNWENKALLRAYQWLHEQIDFAAEGDDTWQPYVVNYFYGTSLPGPVPSRPGKNLGWTDWVFDTAGPAPPAFSPPGGSYDAAQLVVLSHPTSEVTIYFTTDSSMPTTSSTVYAEPIAVSEPTTIQTIAVIPGLTESSVASATYVFQAKMPSFAPSPSLYSSPLSVSLAAATPGAAIYYTVDGSTPTASSPQYTAPIAVGQTTTIRAIAVLGGLADSEVASATYPIEAAAPVFSPAGGRYAISQSVVLTSATPGAVIYYTLEGDAPTTMSSVYAGDAIQISQATTIRAMATAEGFVNSAVAAAGYNFQAAAPAFSPRAGTYGGPQLVSLSSATPDAVIYYTLDGSAPTTASIPYAEPISVTQNNTVRAIAVIPEWSNSSVASATYTLKPVAPAFSPSGKTYDSPQTVSLSHTNPGVVIYYTTDGSTPTTSSSQYTAPIAVTQNTTVKAIAAVAGWSNSSTVTETYTLRPAAPTFSLNGKTYDSPQSVSLSHANPGAVIYYTTDGSTPTTSSPQYTAPIAVTQNTTIKAIAAVAGWSNSSTATEAYTLRPAAPTFSLNGKTYASSQLVALSSTTPGAAIYYTVDESTPTVSSIAYAGPIAVTQNTIVKAIAAVAGWYNSSTATETYLLRAAPPSFGLAGGTYDGPQIVTLAAANPDAIIYYTTDGSNPTVASEIYSGPITVGATTTIKAMAAPPAWTSSAVVTATYTIVIKSSASQDDPTGDSGGGDSGLSVP